MRLLVIPRAINALALRHYSRFGHTSVFMQTGLKIRELPMVVKKVNDVFKIDELRTSGSSTAAPIVFVDKEMSNLMEKMNNFLSVSGLFKFLETIPAEKVTPPVAVHALKRIIHLNNNIAWRNKEVSRKR